MIQSLSAILPVFAVILLGWVLKRARFLPEGFWTAAERLTYYVTFPALLCVGLAGADVSGQDWQALMAVQIIAVLVLSALTIVYRHRLCDGFGLGGPSFAALFQGTNRPNTYMGLALGAALLGPEGLVLTTICVGTVVPLVNMLAVGALSLWGENKAASLWGILKGIAVNPIIIGCAAGATLNATGVGSPWVIGDFLEILGRAALPIGLLAVGAGLVPLALRQTGIPVLANAGLKLIALPILVGLLGWVAGLSPLALAAAVIYASLPCSASAYVMTRTMGGDAPLMASIITFQTIAAGLTIPALVVVLEVMGLV